MYNIAVLLDLDNIKPRLETIEQLCGKYGNMVVKRAFSNTPSVLTAYGSSFRKFDYRFELTPGLNPVSQEVDNLIFQTVDELINNSKLAINLVAIVSNDNDYARLFRYLQSKSIKSLVIGNQIGNKSRENANYVEILTEVMQPTYVGIDLGTTNTVMSLANYNTLRKEWNASVVEVPVKDENGSLVKKAIIPSGVRFTSTDEGEIGGHIKSNAYAFRDQTILAWKHNMGDNLDGKPFEYSLTSGKVSPEKAASQVLSFCRQQLLDKYTNVGGVVITHPASYESDAIEATRKAAVLAGWQEEDVVLLSEPQGALYDFLYSMQRGDIPPAFDVNTPANIMVYDLGGGTLDVTLHQVQWDSNSNTFLINDVAIGSRTRVGGDKVDQLIADYILKNAVNNVNLSPADRDKLGYELPLYAEKFKKLWGSEYFSANDKNNFKLAFQGTFLDNQLPIRHYISVDKMNLILADLLCPDLNLEMLQAMNPETAFDETPFTDRFDTFVVPILDVLLKAKVNTGKIAEVDAILLNGGMTYFPPIKDRLRELFGNIPILDERNPDLAVARGASLYAAGALKSVERVNPTHIYLQTNQEDTTGLRLLIAQGQKYPYKSTLNGLKLPSLAEGYLSFDIWVGMGSKPNVNTNLQRSRGVSFNEILEANLQPGDPLNLEVEYTFDERLLLTLVSQKNEKARFKLEVASDHHNNGFVATTKTMKITSKFDPKTLIPHISRTRKGKEIDDGVRVKFKDWEDVAHQLDRNFNNARLHDRRRDLTKLSAIASNRGEIVNDLLRWLEMDSFWGTSNHPTRSYLAVLCLGEILASLNPEESLALKSAEIKFEQWIQMKINQDLARLDNKLYQAIANIPGKLLWEGFDLKLIEAFKCFQREPSSLVFLNSLGKCGQCNSNNLNFLKNVLKTSKHLGQKEKAAWALSRLISPGQPEEYRIDFKQVEGIAQFALEQLHHVIIKPQVALNMLGCLSQCLAWHALDYELNPSICRQIELLPKSDLPVHSYLSGFRQIESIFDDRIELLPKMLNIATVSEEDSSQIKQFLIDTIRE
ncbi:Hsp70 family protein [Cyanobacterium aponinum AL20118]|uniref:Hsp70 family protein n=1 Tax=Cyanobacterium aponinum AL20115 TaxID=3090662 RepID=A0AAF1C501_9CHRO|nr:Hsp70 family protein [Cyanobacterium aponinum]WPF87895.1 Hsp70 family protein [Cyanobacterium aponinum AL20115]